MPPTDPNIPSRLESDLRASFQAPPIPAHVDDSILSMTRGLALRRRPRRLTVAAAASAAAAAVVVVFWLSGPRATHPTGPAPLAAAIPGDLNGDGKVDMLDALILAQRIEHSQAAPDINADGKIDKADVDALALSAVKLDQGAAVNATRTVFGTAAAVLLAVVVLLSAGWARPQQPAGISFEAIDVFVDSPEPLAAYQVELKDENGFAKIVGIEGGQGVYSQPPYYDPAAMQHEHVLIGALSTAADLPQGLTRVARIHVQVEGGRPRWNAVLMTAGSAAANKINATVKVQAADAADEGARK